MPTAAPAPTCSHTTIRIDTDRPTQFIDLTSHCRALLLAPSDALNVVDGHLQLGRWQRVFLVELDGPRTRDVRCFSSEPRVRARDASSRQAAARDHRSRMVRPARRRVACRGG